MRAKTVTTLVAAMIAALLLCASAGAQIRYASPGGSGDCTTQGEACALTKAVNEAVLNDEIVVMPGTHGPFDAMIGNGTALNLNLHGMLGAPRPKIISTATLGIFLDSTSEATSSRIADLDLFYSGSSLALYPGILHGKVERVFVEASGASYAACRPAGTMVNSVCLGRDNASALYWAINGPTSGYVATLRNVTAVSAGSTGYGLYAENQGGFNSDFNIVNSIIRGAQGDIHAASAGIGGQLDMFLDNSNFETVTDAETDGGNVTVTPPTSAANQTDDPLITDLAAGDLRPLAASPTIDKGLDSPDNGEYDLTGNARKQGAFTDIGAFEFVPPTPPTPPAPPAETFTTITDLKASARAFAIAKRGAAFQPAASQPKKKRGKKPVGTLVSFTLSQADSVSFTLEKATEGRRSGGMCAKKTAKNSKGRKCLIYKPFGKPEIVQGAAGKNTFWFTGRWNGKPLPTSGPGFGLRGTPIKASTGNEPGTLDPRPVKPLKL